MEQDSQGPQLPQAVEAWLKRLYLPSQELCQRMLDHLRPRLDDPRARELYERLEQLLKEGAEQLEAAKARYHAMLRPRTPRR
jgi:hypothetical protein